MTDLRKITIDGVYDDDANPGSLKNWWADTADDDLQGCLPKLAEYGSGDLVAIGADLCHIAGRHNQPDRVKAELGTFFYLRGKVARMTEAYTAGRLPSDDTLHDLTVYSMMLRRIREVGEWR